MNKRPIHPSAGYMPAASFASIGVIAVITAFTVQVHTKDLKTHQTSGPDKTLQAEQQPDSNKKIVKRWCN